MTQEELLNLNNTAAPGRGEITDNLIHNANLSFRFLENQGMTGNAAWLFSLETEQELLEMHWLNIKSYFEMSAVKHLT